MSLPTPFTSTTDLPVEKTNRGLKFSRHFTRQSKENGEAATDPSEVLAHPFDTIAWEKRDAVIKNGFSNKKYEDYGSFLIKKGIYFGLNNTFVFMKHSCVQKHFESLISCLIFFADSEFQIFLKL